MTISKEFISNNNSYAGQIPQYIVIHNTDNFAKTANARAHAKAQHDGNFKGYSAHLFVDDTDTAYQAMPYDRGAWHVGINYGGKLFGTVNNRNSVGIEMCVNAGYDYEKAFKNTVDVCKKIMKELNIPAGRVVTHYDVCNKNCPSAIRAKGDWDRFKQLISGNAQETPSHLYRVRKSWEDAKSQTGAYKILENAKKNCKPGYTVYDENGKAVYSNKKETSTGIQAADLQKLSNQQLIEKIGPLCTADQKLSGVLASVTLAQFILESGWGKSGLTKKANNAFGMKKNLSGNTWPGSAWDGKSVVSMQTGEETEDGKTYTITAEFRAYGSINDSISDHSAYLTGAKNGSNMRYAGLKGETDYKKAAQIIKDGGYATAASYVNSLCKLIEQYDMDKFDIKTESEKTGETGGATKAEKLPFMVHTLTPNLRIRKGPGTNYPSTGYTGDGIFTIVDVQPGPGSETGWGKLKSGAGWIALHYTKKL